MRDVGRGTWAVASNRIDSFSRDKLWRFWEGGGCTEAVRDKGTRSLLAGVAGGYLIFGEVDWSEAQPVAKTITEREALQGWQASG